MIDTIPASCWIYESPDGGETVYRRELQNTKREMIKESHRRKLLRRTQLWYDIIQSAESDKELHSMLEQIEIYHALKHTKP